MKWACFTFKPKLQKAVHLIPIPFENENRTIRSKGSYQSCKLLY